MLWPPHTVDDSWCKLAQLLLPGITAWPQHGGRSVPGVLLNAVYGGGPGGPVVHDNGLASVGGIGGPILRRVVGVGVRVENVVVSSVDHGAALAGCPLETAHT